MGPLHLLQPKNPDLVAPVLQVRLSKIVMQEILLEGYFLVVYNDSLARNLGTMVSQCS